MNIKYLALGSLLVSPLLTGVSVAADPSDTQTRLTAGAELRHDDNLFSKPDASSSMIAILRAQGRLVGKSDYTTFGLNAKAEAANYNDSSPDDYIDWSAGASLKSEPSARHGFSAAASYRHGHDARGSDDTAIQASPNEYDQATLRGQYRFGARSAKGRLEFDLGYNDKDYSNNPSATDALNYDDVSAGATFYWRVAPKTSLLAQYRQTETDYDTAVRDSTLQDYLVGVTWEATAKTTGIVKVGRTERDFDSGTRTDRDSSSWEAKVRWEPRSYASFDLSSSQKIDNATGLNDDSILNTSYRLGWDHKWSAFWTTRVLGTYAEADYENAVNREDETSSLGITAKYALTRDVNLNFGYTYTERDSNIDTNDYERNLVLLSIDWMSK